MARPLRWNEWIRRPRARPSADGWPRFENKARRLIDRGSNCDVGLPRREYFEGPVPTQIDQGFVTGTEDVNACLGCSREQCVIIRIGHRERQRTHSRGGKNRAGPRDCDIVFLKSTSSEAVPPSPVSPVSYCHKVPN